MRSSFGLLAYLHVNVRHPPLEALIVNLSYRLNAVPHLLWRYHRQSGGMELTQPLVHEEMTEGRR